MNQEVDILFENEPRFYTIASGHSFYLWQTRNEGNHCIAIESFVVGLYRKADGDAGKQGWMIVNIVKDSVEVMHNGEKHNLNRRDLLLWHPNI